VGAQIRTTRTTANNLSGGLSTALNANAKARWLLILGLQLSFGIAARGSMAELRYIRGEVALKPCPFCGGEAEERNASNLVFIVRCRTCKATTDRERCAIDACYAWNTRAKETRGD
jgi:Lar family restriction alleviation protein